MGITIGKDELLTLAQAAELFPRGKTGAPVTVSAVWRWAQPGRSPRLETLRVGKRWFTTLAALQEFARACSGDVDPPKVRPRSGRERQIAAAEAYLDAAGIG
jgi:hypothetical protein